MKTKVLFRSDAGNIPEVGTGHIQRAITISKIIKKKFRLKKKEIQFISKTKKKYEISKKILKRNKISFRIYKDSLLRENSIDEINVLSQNPAKLLIIDRWGNTKNNTIRKLKNYFTKIILIDDKCKHTNYDLKINSLLSSKKKDLKFRKFKNLILPSYLYKNFKIKKRNKKNIKNVFLSFGGYDKNSYEKIVLNFFKKKNYNLNLFIPSKNISKLKKFKYKKLNIYYFSSKNFYKYLSKSDISIVSGGLTLFDSIFFEIPTICITQYKHQYENAKILKKYDAILMINLNNINKSLMYNFNKLYKSYKIRKKLIFNGKKIINNNNMKNIINKILKIYER